MTDDERLIDKIEAIRAQNNTQWMNIVRIALKHSAAETKQILREIEQHDGEVRALTQELAKPLKMVQKPSLWKRIKDWFSPSWSWFMP